MEKKKPTKAQMERRIENAIVFVPKTKDTQSIFFSDKGVRLTVTDDKAVIATGYHQHVFDAYNMSGLSRPYLYTKRIVELALENNCEVKDEKGISTGYSYSALLETLSAKEDKTEYNIAYYFGWWLMVIFDGLYSIAEDETSTFLVYFKYMTILAANSILLDEHKEDVTNKQFIEKFQSLISEFTSEISETIVLKAISDEERIEQEINAVRESEVDPER